MPERPPQSRATETAGTTEATATPSTRCQQSELPRVLLCPTCGATSVGPIASRPMMSDEDRLGRWWSRGGLCHLGENPTAKPVEYVPKDSEWVTGDACQRRIDETTAALRALCGEAAHHLRTLPEGSEVKDCQMAARLEEATRG